MKTEVLYTLLLTVLTKYLIMSKRRIPQSSFDTSNTDLHGIVKRFKDEITVYCTNVKDFNLPDDYFFENPIERVKDVPCKTGKRKSKRKNAAAKRQKDKERKRKKRRMKKEALLSAVDNSGTDNLCESPWKTLYTENTSYREKKRKDSKLRYNVCLPYQEATKERSKTQYENDPSYRKRASATKYKSNIKYQKDVKQASTDKYKSNLEFQKSVKQASTDKYKSKLEFQKAVKQASTDKYKSNLEFQKAIKQASTDKYKSNLEFQKSVKQASTDKYKSNLEFQKAVKQASTDKYKSNLEFQKAIKQASTDKYKSNLEFQKAVKQASTDKYKSNLEFQKAIKQASTDKYKSNLEFQKAIKQASTDKYKSNLEFQKAVKQASTDKYKSNLEFQKAVKQASTDKYKTNVNFKEQLKQKYKDDSEYAKRLKTLMLLKYRHDVLIRERKKQTLRQHYIRNQVIRERKIRLIQQKRCKHIMKITELNQLSTWFNEQVRDGPTFICSVCDKFKFRKQVIECKDKLYTERGAKCKAIADLCINQTFCAPCSNQCEKICKVANHKLWICYTCHRHILGCKMPVDAHANGLQLPVIPEELKGLNKLERQLVSLRIPFMKIVQLPKGKQRGVIGPCVSVPTDVEKTTKVLPHSNDEAQLIRCKLKRKLTYKGHSQYEFVSSKKIATALDVLKTTNPHYHEMTFNKSWNETVPPDFQDITTRENNSQENTDEQIDNNEQQDEELSICNNGMPSDTCLQPVDIGQEMLDQHFDDIFCVAPGEGKTPVAMMQEEGNEAMSFPVQFSDGNTGTYDSKRKHRITRTRYFHTRLLNADSRFASDPSYIFYAQYLSELELVISKVSIALRKGSCKDRTGSAISANMLTDRNQLKNLLTSDQGYKFLTPIRGTPPFWQAALRDLMATIRQLGIPTWFATFSAADMRWTEILKVMMEQQQCTQLLENLDWTGKAEILRNNPVMNAIMFDHRFNTFLKEIIIKCGIIGEVKDYFHRIEFQQRGSPHAHCLFWIKDAPELDKEGDQTVCDFIDKYVTCELPNKNTDPDLYEKVTSVQQHSKNHSKACKTKSTTCRFNFPRPPSRKTFISRPKNLTDQSEKVKTNAQNILKKLWTVIQDGNVENITTDNLFHAAGITQEDFETASSILTKRISITLKRSASDVWINQYNPQLLRCWNANLDLQYITDPYSCVMYIISYISKAEREMGAVLENARKEASDGNLDSHQAMKKISGAYFRQREVSAQEASYRVCGLHLKQSSRKVQFAPTGDNQVKMSLPLNVIKMKVDHLEEDSIWMPSLYDRYKSRPDTDEFHNLSYASFCSEYRILSASQVPKDLSKSNAFKLQNNLGYIMKRSRTDPAIVRFARFSPEKQPELYYQSSLQLFLPHRTDSQLKPQMFDSYEEMYKSGAVVIPPMENPKSVKTIVDMNRQKIEINADALDEAQDIIDMHGPLDDAWALIAPEAEADRFETKDKQHITDEDSLEIPDLDTLRRPKSTTGNDIEIRQTKFPRKEMQTLKKQLNKEQMSVFYQIRQWCLDKINGKNPDPFCMFINGGAGTGKSQLIKCLYHEATEILSPHTQNPDNIVVLLTAPTATAAFHIGGITLHQAFSLKRYLPLPYVYMRDDELNKLRSKYQSLNILIIDEISMVGQRVLVYVNERLRQIKQSGSAVFGNICVVAVGDFYQLPPVKQKCLFDLRAENFFPLWSSNFSIVELKQIMRQKDDLVFAQLLNRLRIKKKTESLQAEDRHILDQCIQRDLPADTLHIFGKNDEVDSHNSNMISTICEHTEIIPAQDYDKDPKTGRLTPRETPYDTKHDFLPAYLQLGKNARVMLTRNIDVTGGLVNGAMGTITELLPKKPGSSILHAVKVLFDNEKITLKNDPSQPMSHQSIQIKSIEEDLQNNAVRRQLPLQLAWACTAHKVQGMTTNKAVVSMKNVFAAGMAYVALSRVTSMNGLSIQDFDENKIYCNEEVLRSTEIMPKFLIPDNIQTVNENHISILLHNIQGLKAHIDDLRANPSITNVNVICLTETWLENDSLAPELDNLLFKHKPRCLSYPFDRIKYEVSLRESAKTMFKDLESAKHGGVGIYVDKKTSHCYNSMNSIMMECVVMNVKDIKTNLVLIYKPKTYTTSLFLEELNKILMMIRDDDMSTILLGDFNENILKSYTPIKDFMENHGFSQLVIGPTTDGDTCIDHVYLSGNLKVSLQTLQTYYSYHNMILLKVAIK